MANNILKFVPKKVDKPIEIVEDTSIWKRLHQPDGEWHEEDGKPKFGLLWIVETE